MPTLCRLPLVISILLLSIGIAFAQEVHGIQWAPVPADANEPVTGMPKVLTNPQERSQALQLLDRARQNYTFYGPQQPAFTMNVSFSSSGQSEFEGEGSMHETWFGSVVRWSAKIGTKETLRVIYHNQVWGDDSPVPMRVQMARAALLWPVVNPPARVMLRTAPAVIHGTSAVCILTSGSMGPAPQPRHWVEKEYCIDPENGNLLLWSEGPGHFVVYDYTTSTQFQGHVVANDVTIYEAGGRVMLIHVDGIQDPGVKPDSLRPSPQLMAGPRSFVLAGPMKYPLPMPPDQGVMPVMIQPVFVHATLDREGHVIEAEALQNSNPELATRAIDVLKSHNQGSSGVQREVFVNVEFQIGSPALAGAQ